MIFDLDGTLGETVPICIQAFQQTLHHYLGWTLMAPDVIAMFGPSEEGMLQRQLPQTWPAALEVYLKEYERAHVTCPAPFPGLTTLLTGLRRRGLRLGIVTGKGLRSATISARVLGFGRLLRTD
jgi:phosphoglycolate phosphatase/pyrophosphatase PpaX